MPFFLCMPDSLSSYISMKKGVRMLIAWTQKEKRKAMTVLILAGCLLLGVIVFFSHTALLADAQTGIPVPILMYHSILKDPAKAGKYTVSPSVLESDLQYLKDHGYTTIFVQDLIDYVYLGTELPDKPVILTFDDGYLNNLTYVLPLLEQYDCRATISVVGSYCQRWTDMNDPNPNYAYLTWDDVKTLAQSGRVEIGNHTYDMHALGARRGCAQKKGESDEVYQSLLYNDLSHLQQDLQTNSGVSCRVFAYPFGSISKNAQSVLESLGFQASLSCSETISYVTRDPASLWNLGRFNRPSHLSTETFMHKALGA